MYWKVYLSGGTILILALAARALEGRWIAPSSFFSLVWVVASVPACFLIPEVIQAPAVLTIAAFQTVAILGSLVGRSWAEQDANAGSTGATTPPKRAGNGLAWMVLILGASGYAAALSYVQNEGWQLRDLLRAETWLSMAATYSSQRYSGVDSETLGVRFLLGLNYAGALLSGVLIAATRLRSLKLLAFVPLSATLLVTVITTAKTPLMLATLLLVSAYISCARWSESSRVSKSGWRRSAAAIVLVACLLAVSVLSLTLRYGKQSQVDPDLVATRFQSYVFGYMAAWSAWATPENLFSAPSTAGQLTFAGAFEVLGLAARSPGLYTPIAANDVAAESNVFTAFRGLISDVSLPAALLTCFACTTLAGFSYVRLSQRRHFAWPAIYLTAYITLVGWSPIVSIFIYNSVIFTFILASVLFCVFNSEIEHRLRQTAVRSIDPLAK